MLPRHVSSLKCLSRNGNADSEMSSGIIIASLALSVFLMALVSRGHAQESQSASYVARILNLIQDNTIIATAIPKITDHFKALDDVGWYGSGRHAPVLH